MKRIHILGGVLAAAVLAGGAAAIDVALPGSATPASAAPASAAPAAPAGLGTAALAPGTALVDGTGRSVYLFEADTGTQSTCNGACAQVWPPLLAQGAMPPVAMAGAASAVQGPLVGTSARADGALQVTYDGHPLYYFAGDTAPGQVKGQGIHNFGGGWYVVAPSGQKIDPDDPAPAPAPIAPPAAPAPAAPAPAPAAPAPAAPALSGYGY